MNYPVWYIPFLSDGLPVAIIAIIHVFIAHFAVGGGLFLVLTEKKAYETNDSALLDYVKRHTSFFLLLTMVLGGMTGVGIWFIIALTNPAATSSLIHNFVFGWATEWVFFIGEIVALLLYKYRFGKIDKKSHLTLGWFYFIFAWLSLFIINGIVGFMLTPGAWLETKNFWDGFFNPSFFPSLIFRTGISVLLAGVFALVTGVFTKDDSFRKKVMRYSVSWILVSVPIIVFSGIWYYKIIPNIGIVEPISYFSLFSKAILITLAVVIVGAILLIPKMSKTIQSIFVAIVVLFALFWMGSFEYLREIARKPYVINNFMYSNMLTDKDMEIANKDGFLKNAKWSKIKDISNEHYIEAGRELFKFQCLSCHSIGGYNDIVDKTAFLSEKGIYHHLKGQGKVRKYMPPFMGIDDERIALAKFIYEELHGKKSDNILKEPDKDYETPEPEFDSENDEYVLFVNNDLGMHCLTDVDSRFGILPPANSLVAQLIKRGETPEVITEGVKIKYEIEEGFKNPEKHLDFWDWSNKIYGVKLEKGVGVKGKKVIGEFELHEDNNYFTAEAIPVAPYKDNNKFMPYPTFKVDAILEETNEVIASTYVVAPVSSEMGCKNCHGGEYRVDGRAGFTKETAENFLIAHDRAEGTTLYKDALAGEPKLCQSCHPDPILGSKGKDGVPPFSASIHGFHANYMDNMAEEACSMCHPSAVDGVTECFRGRHAESGLTCIECHGDIEQHALGLLKSVGGNTEKKLGASLDAKGKDIMARIPWKNEPDCMSCHEGYEIGGIDAYGKWTSDFNTLYRNREAEGGILCITCHGAPHAVYPATNSYSENRDNIQPIQYQNIAGTIGTKNNCKVCHKIDMEFSLHHENMLNN